MDENNRPQNVTDCFLSNAYTPKNLRKFVHSFFSRPNPAFVHMQKVLNLVYEYYLLLRLLIDVGPLGMSILLQIPNIACSTTRRRVLGEHTCRTEGRHCTLSIVKSSRYQYRYDQTSIES